MLWVIDRTIVFDLRLNRLYRRRHDGQM